MALYIHRARYALKRLLDVLLALALLLLFSPLLLAVSALVWLQMGRPIFFRQLRPGLGAQPFTIIKFRTMAQAPTNEHTLEHNAKRLTPLGRFLRRTSLDELPELINILRSDMSFVGPRPLRLDYIEHYSDEEMRRHEVRPGVTGWAQVNGRNTLSWESKMAHDLWYIDNWSLWLDARILLLTGIALFDRSSVAEEGGHAMPKTYVPPQKEPE